MNKTETKTAAAKYADAFKTDPTATAEQIKLDFPAAGEAEAILAILNEPDKGADKKSDPKADIAKKQANHPNYKWFDEFQGRIQKKSVMNQYTQREQTIITGWELTKKLHPKFIEPHIATQLNSFMNGFQGDDVGLVLVPRDKFKTGDVIPYKDWAKEQGKDFTTDLNILLIPKD